MSDTSPSDFPLPVVPSREEFIESMGPASSHPKFRPTRIRWLRRFASAGISLFFVGVGLVAWGALSFDAVFRMSSWFATQIDRIAILLGFLGFALAATLTFALHIRMSVSAFSARPTRDTYGIRAIATCLLALAIIAVVPYYGAKYSSGNLRWMINLFAVLPLPLFILWIEWADEDDRTGKVVSKAARVSLAVGFALSMTACLGFHQWLVDLLQPTTSSWIAKQLSALDWKGWLDGGSLTSMAPAWLREAIGGTFGSQVQSVLQGVVGIVTTSAGGMVRSALTTVIDPIIGGLLRFMTIIVMIPMFILAASLSTCLVCGLGDGTKAEVPKRLGFFRRMLSIVLAPIRWIFGKRLEGGEPVDPSDESTADSKEQLPPWVDELAQSHETHPIDGVDRFVEGTVAGLDTDFSESAPDGSMDWLFGGFRPTMDQLDAFCAFRQSFVDSMRELEQTGFEKQQSISPDMFLESIPGSGASSVLRACAIYSSIARGQRVLILCSRARAVDATIGELGRALKRVGLDEICAVGSLRQDSIHVWCTPAGQTPDVLVATMAEWEKFCQNPGLDRASLRQTILGIEVVLVDDFARMRGDFREAMHLPFVLGKQRLLLQSEYRLMQLVVASPHMGDGVREMIGKRLFGGTQSPASYQLRRWRSRKPLVIDVRLQKDGLEAALKACAKFCLERRLNVLVFKSGADPKERERLQSSLRFAGRIPEVAVDIEDLSSEQRTAFDAVFYRQAAREDCAISLSSRLPNGGVVFLRFVEPTTAGAHIHVDPIPVLSSLRSRDLALAHMKSACVHLSSNAPIPRNPWARFGLGDLGSIESLGCVRSEKFIPDTSLPSLIVDPMEGDKWVDETRSREWSEIGVWQTITVKKGSTRDAMASIDMSEPVKGDSRLEVHVGSGEIVLGRSDSPIDRRRIIEWSSSQQQKLGTADLAYCDRMIYRYGNQAFRGVTFKSAAGSLTETAKVTSDFYRDEPHDPVIPVLDVSVEIEPHAKISGPRMGPPDGVEWYDFSADRRPLTCLTRIMAIADEHGDQHSLQDPLTFTMDCSASMMTIGMKMPSDHRTEWIRSVASGWWKTSEIRSSTAPREFWPLLTSALQIALRSMIPELLAYARVMVFRAPAGCSGCIVLIVEPLSTAGTAAEAMSAVLSEPLLCARLANEFESAIHQPADRSKRIIESPMYARKIEGERSEDVSGIIEILRRNNADIPIKWRPIGQVGIILSPAPASDDEWKPLAHPESHSVGFPREGGSSKVEGSTKEWEDHHRIEVREWHGDVCYGMPNEKPVEYGVVLGEFETLSVADTNRFGYCPTEFEGLLSNSESPLAAEAYLKNCGFQLTSGCPYVDYEWMISESIPAVRSLATAIVDRAVLIGATSLRAKVAAIYTFVISLEYESIAELPDGKCRWEVRMPTSSLYRNKGDCDSVSVLFLALLRASGLNVKAGIVCTHDHAIVGLSLPAGPSDDYVDFPTGRVILLECTEGQPENRRIGRIGRSLVGTAVTIEALG